MTRVLMVYPQFRVLGGAEIVALHLLRWLLTRPGVEVTLLTLHPVDLEELQRNSGILFNGTSVRVVEAFCPAFVRDADQSMTILKLAFLHRHAKRISREYVLCITPYGEEDFGVRGVQLIHHPTFVSKRFLHRFKMTGNTTILDRWLILAELYRGLIYAISGNRPSGYRRNLTIPSTEFIRGVLEEAYGITGEVLYPAVLPDNEPPETNPWEKREFLIVALGRLAPDKNYLRLLELFRAIHIQFPESQFVIIGRIGNSAYAEMLQRKVSESGLPVRFVTGASNEEVREYLSRARFLLHAKEFEHFGIALVEAANYGCLPLAHDSGGAPEILPSILLRYRTEDELVRNLARICTNDALRRAIQNELREGLVRFRLPAFEAGLDRLLTPFLAVDPDPQEAVERTMMGRT